MKIVLATLHAKYIHASLALPCLAASVRDVKGIVTAIHEFTVNEQPQHILERLLDEVPDLVAFSCYIWNVEQSLKIADDLKKLLPSTVIVAGGPEVSHDAEELLRKNPAVDCVIRGEGEQTWSELVDLLAKGLPAGKALESVSAGITWQSAGGTQAAPARRTVRELDSLPSPFSLGLVDMSKPLVYYETSRGCPFSCAFCLSSLEKGVRSFSMDRIRSDLSYLMEHKAKVVKLVDRTFNYDAERADEIWNFILSQNSTCCFHFEIAADLLTESNLATLKHVPEDRFRFEIGIQATGEETLHRVNRTSSVDRLLDKVRRLRDETNVTLHLDLVAGLPGEDLPGFLVSLQRLFELHPHYIQVEPLKVLKGSPMVGIAKEEGYAYSSSPPYKILKTPQLSFHDIAHIEEIARLLDIYHNSGRFASALQAVGEFSQLSIFFSEMARFMKHEKKERNLSLRNAFEIFASFIDLFLSPAGRETVTDALCYDFCMADYPVSGKLPSFFEICGNAASHPSDRGAVERFVKNMQIPPGSRIRTFNHAFSRDYRTFPARTSNPIHLTFFYVSRPGKGLKVEAHCL